MLFILIGKSGSGKPTLFKEYVNTLDKTLTNTSKNYCKYVENREQIKKEKNDEKNKVGFRWNVSN